MPAGRMPEIQARAWARFKEVVSARGWEVAEPAYLGSKAKHRVRCAMLHTFLLVPNAVQQGSALCPECPKPSGAMRVRFEAKISESGGRILDPWTRTKSLYRIRCALGHETAAKPINLLMMQGICKVCNQQKRARRMLDEFRARIEALGGTVIEEEWKGALTPHLCRCPQDHECRPRPSSVQNGQGMCRTCSGNTTEAAWESFLVRMQSLGAEVLEEAWRGAEVPHRVRCRGGHDIKVWPSGAGKGRGICRTCAGLNPKEAEKGFQSAVRRLGGQVLYDTWAGVNAPHLIRCPAGHLTSPRPNDVQQGHTLCRACAGKDPATAWRNFTATVESMGGEVLEPTWMGTQIPHAVRCPQGHITRVRPASAQQGQGICRFCAGRSWDVFYVVMDEATGHVKIGITSGDPRHRLRTHRADGFGRVLRLMEDLPGEDAPNLEKSVQRVLRSRGQEPIRGREYYGAKDLPAVLHVVDAYKTDGNAIRHR